MVRRSGAWFLLVKCSSCQPSHSSAGGRENNAASARTSVTRDTDIPGHTGSQALLTGGPFYQLEKAQSLHVLMAKEPALY